jgi:hypothetical protein
MRVNKKKKFFSIGCLSLSLAGIRIGGAVQHQQPGALTT